VPFRGLCKVKEQGIKEPSGLSTVVCAVSGGFSCAFFWE
jgi:hypothetical protein